MSWIYLIIAGLFEIGWPLGFKLASTYTKYNILFFGVSVISMALGGVFLYLAQKTISLCYMDRFWGSWHIINRHIFLW